VLEFRGEVRLWENERLGGMSLQAFSLFSFAFLCLPWVTRYLRLFSFSTLWKADYQASETVIGESERVMGMKDDAWTLEFPL